MNKNQFNLGIIYGSTRKQRFCDTVVAWAAKEIAADKRFSFTPIDPQQLQPAAELGGVENNELAPLIHTIEKADAFVVVTPEYNHGYPAPLKFLIDAVKDPWRAKPVGFVSYGGISGGLRAVEQLRLVFAELEAQTMRSSVSLAFPWQNVNRAGELVAQEQSRKVMVMMLEQLHWWAKVLQAAREV